MNYSAGCRRLETTPSAYSDAIPVLVMYPSTTLPRQTKTGPYLLNVAMNAPIATGIFPLAIISHGRRSYGLVFHTLARFLSENGFIVALPNHPGDNLFQRQSACSYQNLEERPKQITAVIDTLTTHKLFGCAIQTNNVGVIGHSAGGYTALAIAGGEPHTGFMVKSALACQPSQSRGDAHMGSSLLPITIIPAKPDLRVRAVRAVVALAPDFSLFMHQRALAKISIPVLLMVAQRDR